MGVGTGWDRTASVSGSAAVGSGAFGPGVGWRACTVSGNCVVAFSGTLGSTRLLNTLMASVDRSDSESRALMAWLEDALRPGLIGNAYWYTT